MTGTNIIQPVIRTMLLDNPEVYAATQGRIFDISPPGTRPQLPAITLQRISETLNPLTMARSTRIQVDCYAYSHAGANDLAEAVQRALTNRSLTQEDLAVFSIRPGTIIDYFTVDTRTYRTMADYTVAWRTTA